MSVIKTYKCDGCGAITRSYPDEWFLVEVERMARRNHKSFLDAAFNGKSGRHAINVHICSVDCVGPAMNAHREDVEALELPA